MILFHSRQSMKIIPSISQNLTSSAAFDLQSASSLYLSHSTVIQNDFMFLFMFQFVTASFERPLGSSFLVHISLSPSSEFKRRPASADNTHKDTAFRQNLRSSKCHISETNYPTAMEFILQAFCKLYQTRKHIYSGDLS